jgi:prevent-host-death family protein
MSTVGAFDAKTHFSELLKEVEQGGQVIITKHGRPVAKLLPAQGLTQENICLAIQKILDFSKSHTLGNLDWKELRDEGRRNEF